MDRSPLSVSVIIPALDAVGKIERALDSIQRQDYENIVEVIVAAGDDETLKVAADLGAITIENPTGSTPAALNLAIEISTGEVIVRCDAQSVLPPDYISTAVATMERTGADNVGGMQIPDGETFWERAIAAAMASRLGAGDARYRTGGEEGPVETVYLGVFRRAKLEELGGFDEEFARNQDYELNHRIIESGGTVWFDPNLRVRYRPRGSLGELARQYYRYGQAKKMFTRRHPGSLRWRQLAPPLLVIGLILCSIAAFITLWALLGPAVYVLALAIGTAILPSAAGKNLGTIPALAVMHIAWGLGFLNGPANG